MTFQQFYLNCLAHASYLIADGGEAAVVDPQRDVDQYINEANSIGARIKYVLETHLHADFVSGHRELVEHVEDYRDLPCGSLSQAVEHITHEAPQPVE